MVLFLNKKINFNNIVINKGFFKFFYGSFFYDYIYMFNNINFNFLIFFFSLKNFNFFFLKEKLNDIFFFNFSNIFIYFRKFFYKRENNFFLYSVLSTKKKIIFSFIKKFSKITSVIDFYRINYNSYLKILLKFTFYSFFNNFFFFNFFFIFSKIKSYFLNIIFNIDSYNVLIIKKKKFNFFFLNNIFSIIFLLGNFTLSYLYYLSNYLIDLKNSFISNKFSQSSIIENNFFKKLFDNKFFRLSRKYRLQEDGNKLKSKSIYYYILFFFNYKNLLLNFVLLNSGIFFYNGRDYIPYNIKLNFLGNFSRFFFFSKKNVQHNNPKPLKKKTKKLFFSTSNVKNFFKKKKKSRGGKKKFNFNNFINNINFNNILSDKDKNFIKNKNNTGLKKKSKFFKYSLKKQ